MRASLILIFADPWLWTTLCCVGGMDEEYESGRSYVLNPLRLSWGDAASACREMGGDLAVIRSMSTLPTIQLEGDWTFWIGLTKNEEGRWLWSNSDKPMWTNWQTTYIQNLQIPKFGCASAVTMMPYWWQPKNCSSPLPSLCELQEGECTFVRHNHSSVIANNVKIPSGVDLEECKRLCETETDFTCRSFEYNSKRHYCQMSDVDRHTSGIRFTESDEELDYYHRTCDTGRLKAGYTVSPIGIITQEYKTTPDPTTPEPTSSLFCTQLKSIDPNTTEPVPEEVKELQSMNVVFKARQTTLKRISVPDARPSATYVGSSAVIISFSIIGAIVLCDLFTLPRHCRNAHGRLKQKKKEPIEMKFADRSHLNITDHMNGVKLHMQHLSKNNTATDSKEENVDPLTNAEVLSEHSFSKIMNTDVGEDGIVPNGTLQRKTSSRTYDWSDEEDPTEPRDILEIEIECDTNDAKSEDVDLDASSGSSKYIYRTYMSTDL
ncbi:uncharacterized protein LOC124278517 isoform X1 [Haliotis rubra]|uniref:uncharacterized protein LOC124278517 isoform X1 n=2 Tax=Haliotis rubra TaxID=36100 RepID=UPI001EE60CFF|nr:uncharacterized protein LOC124278517 isoform X1 [Haliotis rubra]XP_046570177.1 uncharacterized protein LOC124278517 isoform X1 [Haliotis rubra]XP_046570178.1 uncharacterized protein LOC124278517 isoform X1 [Haliotis rubra]XP_046570179.1 uncharacterized protein LOC124278517 isoform X1 [Haliotis rubra]XP_046570180.1 uncharacterized protein LOC124278517 isoform X1 [Haliotis rubra]XP_046570181.1 uncharacterized protein LOC124278517 isoform X1 [Haliotis rubra]XP_046570182.1 uncharacterized prot